MNSSLWEFYIKATHLKWLGELDAWAKLDITMSQFKVLMILSHNKEMNISQLAETLGVSLPNMIGIVDRLIQQDYLLRVKSDNDGRVINIKQTEKARNMLFEIEQSGRKKFSDIESKLTDIEKETISLGLKVLINAYEKSNT